MHTQLSKIACTIALAVLGLQLAAHAQSLPVREPPAAAGCES
jgi:hypothetical protein